MGFRTRSRNVGPRPRAGEHHTVDILLVMLHSKHNVSSEVKPLFYTRGTFLLRAKPMLLQRFLCPTPAHSDQGVPTPFPCSSILAEVLSMKRTQLGIAACVNDAVRPKRDAPGIQMQIARNALTGKWPILYIPATPLTKANWCYRSLRIESRRLRLPVHGSQAYPFRNGTSPSQPYFPPAQSRPGAGVPGTPPASAYALPLLEPGESPHG